MARTRIDATDKHVGRRVRMRRMMLNMTQAKFAEVLGLTYQHIQRCEKGINRIPAGRLQQIARVLEVPVPYFFEGASNDMIEDVVSAKFVPDYVTDFLSTRDGLDLARAFQRISGRTRRAIVGLVEQIVPE